MPHDEPMPLLGHLPSEVPAVTTGLQITLRHSDAAILRGVPDRVAEAVGDRLADALPLLRAGYGAVAPDAGAGLDATVAVRADGLTVTLTRAAHHPLLVQLVLRLVLAESQTPPGAWQRLLSALDGDEEAAREAFEPLAHDDIAALSLVVEGDGTGHDPRPFAPLDVWLHPELVLLAADIARQVAADSEDEDGALYIPLPPGAALGEAIENGFLSLQNARVFSASADASDPLPEPELYVVGQPPNLVVQGWADDPAWLAELVRVLVQGARSRQQG